jgi:hypothetical protein
MLWVVCTLAAFSATPASSERADDHSLAAANTENTFWEATSENFIVHSRHPAHDARQVAEFCERWRAKLQRHWCAEERASWEPRCEVVLHPDIRSYLSAVGAGASQTFGSSLIQFASGKGAAGKQVSRRLIDFRGDSAFGLAAVPHEMTHVVLADLLDGRQPPRWADEGMAILADSREKQLLHERDLASGLAGRTAFRVTELLTLESYPAPSRIPAFYGQSASVTALLVQRDDPAKFVEFLRRSFDQGYDQALRDVYHIRNLADLERLWHDQRFAWKGGYHGVRLALD